MESKDFDKRLDGLVGGDGDREFIINICVASAMFFNKRPTIEEFNKVLANEGQPPLTDAEKDNLKRIVKK